MLRNAERLRRAERKLPSQVVILCRFITTSLQKCFEAKQLLKLNKRVSNTFSNQYGMSGLQETWIMLDELDGAILRMFFFSIIQPSNIEIKQQISTFGKPEPFFSVQTPKTKGFSTELITAQRHRS